nr:chemotaxis protein CheA [uncultured Bacillus sp.]
MDTSQYLEVFIEESKEHLQACNENLLLLEKHPDDPAIVNEIFRSAHTLKGMSATMGYEDLANLTHQMENVLDAIRNKIISFTPEILDVIFIAVDHLEAMIQSIAQGGDGTRDVSTVVEQLKLIESGKKPATNEDGHDTATDTAEVQKSDILYDEFERTVIEQSKEQGFQVYEITVSQSADCLLKAARAFMVFTAMEKMGEIIKSSPSVEQLEEENFDRTFSVTLITKEETSVIEQTIMQISEVESVSVQPLSFDSIEAVPDTLNTQKAEETATTSVKQVSEQKATPDSDPSKNHSAVKQSNKTIRVNIERLDILLNLFEELVIDRGRLEQISFDLKDQELQETVDRMSRTTSDLQNIILNMRMIPIETVFNRFPRMVRQLARDLHKKINLDIRGAETELDRTVIDEIGDPLVHLIRNSIDHGIEMPDVRRERGKSDEGTVVLKAYHSGNHVMIEIEDDGNGISREKILQKALKNGIVSPQNAALLTNQQVYELIFASGFSTAEKISDISGRGVGLDVVKNTIENLGGNVSVDSVEGAGSVFTIQLPLTLSIISVLLVGVQEEKYSIPLNSIIETAIIKNEDTFLAHNQRVMDFRGKIIPLLYLKDIFNVPITEEENGYTSVVIVRKGEKIAALVVDSFIGQQEIVLKSLGDYFVNVFAISGATILGNGQVALVVDCNALLK